jgi:hypothetical protein
LSCRTHDGRHYWASGIGRTLRQGGEGKQEERIDAGALEEHGDLRRGNRRRGGQNDPPYGCPNDTRTVVTTSTRGSVRARKTGSAQGLGMGWQRKERWFWTSKIQGRRRNVSGGCITEGAVGTAQRLGLHEREGLRGLRVSGDRHHERRDRLGDGEPGRGGARPGGDGRGGGSRRGVGLSASHGRRPRTPPRQPGR